MVEWANFEEQILRWDAELDLAYQTAWGAVLYGVRWTGTNVDEVSKDEALECAAEFLQLLKSRRG